VTAPAICASHASAPPASTKPATRHGDSPSGESPTPAAHASTIMYAPGGPTASALHTQTAIIAITDTVTTPSQGMRADQSPRATARANDTAMAPR
jgi:hypothetical protein